MEESTIFWLTKTIAYITLFFAVFTISRFFFKLKNKKFDFENELTVKDNVAFSVLTVGYFIGVLIIFMGVLYGEAHDLITDSILVLGYTIIGNLLLLLASVFNEKVVFGKKFKFYKEIIRDENVGTGCIEAANFIGASLIIYGAISGKSINLFPELESTGLYISDLLSLVVFWVIGQLILFIGLKTYAKVAGYDFVKEVQKDNNAVGIVYASVLIAIAYIYASAVKGDMESWFITFENIAYSLVLGGILLPLSRVFIERVILPKSNLTHEIVHQEVPNKGAALIEAFAYIGSAIVISYCM